jgi:hypothetical protein
MGRMSASGFGGACAADAETQFTVLPDWLVPFGHYGLCSRRQACEQIANGDSAEEAAPHCKDPVLLQRGSTTGLIRREERTEISPQEALRFSRPDGTRVECGTVLSQVADTLSIHQREALSLPCRTGAWGGLEEADRPNEMYTSRCSLQPGK